MCRASWNIFQLIFRILGSIAKGQKSERVWENVTIKMEWKAEKNQPEKGKCEMNNNQTYVLFWNET